MRRGTAQPWLFIGGRMTNDGLNSGALPWQTADALREIALGVEKGKVANPVCWEIALSELGTQTVDAVCKDIATALGPKCLSVYAIHLDESVPLDEFHNLVGQVRLDNQAREKAERRAYARINKARDCVGSRCVYVGKSEDTASRLKQHLIEATRSTYSIHFKHWVNDLPGNLIVSVFAVTNLKPSLLTYIEDQVAKDARPILGRRGSV